MLICFLFYFLDILLFCAKMGIKLSISSWWFSLWLWATAKSCQAKPFFLRSKFQLVVTFVERKKHPTNCNINPESTAGT
jgi:hypothetical protein